MMNQDEEFKQHIEMTVEHKKTPIEYFQSENRRLRLELSTLRFKESQEQRFIWWIWNVYSRNVCDLIYSILGATTYDTEGEAKDGKYSLPKHCFDLMKRIDEYTEHIYDGTYLDVEISTENKTAHENRPAYNENANSLLRSAWMIASRNGEQTNWEAFKNAVYKELLEEHKIKTSTDNNKYSWIPFKREWAAPACNSRQLVKLKNGWITIATYLYKKDHGNMESCWQWKDDRGQWLDQDVVIYWKGLEE